MKHENFKRCKELVEQIDKLRVLKFELNECGWFEIQVTTNAGRILSIGNNDEERGNIAHGLMDKLRKDTDQRLAKLYKELDPL